MSTGKYITQEKFDQVKQWLKDGNDNIVAQVTGIKPSTVATIRVCESYEAYKERGRRKGIQTRLPVDDEGESVLVVLQNILRELRSLNYLIMAEKGVDKKPSGEQVLFEREMEDQV